MGNVFDGHFAKPEYLYLLLILVPMTLWYILGHGKNNASIQVSTLKNISGLPPTYKHYLRHSLFAFRILAIASLVVVLARPRKTDNWKNVTTEGIDIVMAMDVSSSMLAKDFNPDRLEAAKDVAIQFITGRPMDRMGLVVFSGESFTQCPLTVDHTVLINLIKDINSGILVDGTAIGQGLANAVNRLKDSDSKSKVVILLTDGVNNSGSIAPFTAAEIAKTFGIRVYTIGVGSMGEAPYPYTTPFGTRYKNMPVEIDETILKRIAQMTGGKYFRATNKEKLTRIYQEIDKMEKTKIHENTTSNTEEKYLIWALLALGFIVMEIIARNTVFRSIP